MANYYNHSFNAYPDCIEHRHNQVTEGQPAAENWPGNSLTINHKK